MILFKGLVTSVAFIALCLCVGCQKQEGQKNEQTPSQTSYPTTTSPMNPE